MKKYDYIKRYLLLAVLAACSWVAVQSQSIFDLRLNEVLSNNVENFEDDFGVRNSWFEVFNSAYGTVDIGGCYLTDNLKNPTKYPIPKGDVLTKIKPRQHVLFWADNKPTHGTFHVNFTLAEANFIALFSSDGKTLIDSITFPQLAADTSFGRIIDGDTKWGLLERTTPSSTNIIVEQESANQRLLTNDPAGIIMTLTAMLVVFSSLIVLFLLFKTIGNGAVSLSNKRAQRAVAKQEKYKKPSISESASVRETGEICAAITMALHEYLKDEHDIETTILTIHRVRRAYSPWNSKIYTLREIPNKLTQKR
ncbi:MAG: OadG family protein [Bacteroidales bacterium]|jgi:Na+-transporting methylmalonyl-CoA/oxaloacetate decarboxylase gamma subunit|nr:OadG family protein [Bacteroidales bacterium]